MISSKPYWLADSVNSPLGVYSAQLGGVTHDALTADQIGNHAKAELAHHGPGRSGDLDGRVRFRGNLAAKVDNAQHVGDEANGEDVVLARRQSMSDKPLGKQTGGSYRIAKEANTGNHDGTDMIPTEGGPVHFGESQAAALVVVGNVGKVVAARQSALRDGRVGGRPSPNGTDAKLWKAAFPPDVMLALISTVVRWSPSPGTP